MSRHGIVTLDLARHIRIGPQTTAAAISMSAKIMSSVAVPEWIEGTSGEYEGWNEKHPNDGREPVKDFFHGTVQGYS